MIQWHYIVLQVTVYRCVAIKQVNPTTHPFEFFPENSVLRRFACQWGLWFIPVPSRNHALTSRGDKLLGYKRTECEYCANYYGINRVLLLQ
jgi:hypothetical protein